MDSNKILDLIKEHLAPDMYIYPNRFNPIDAIIESKDIAVEVKCKNSFYSNVIIEKQKWQSLMKHKAARYINAMDLDGRWKVFSFNIKQLPEPIWVKKMIPNASNELYTGWVETEVGYYNIGDGKNITKDLKL